MWNHLNQKQDSSSSSRNLIFFFSSSCFTFGKLHPLPIYATNSSVLTKPFYYCTHYDPFCFAIVRHIKKLGFWVCFFIQVLHEFESHFISFTTALTWREKTKRSCTYRVPQMYPRFSETPFFFEIVAFFFPHRGSRRTVQLVCLFVWPRSNVSSTWPGQLGLTPAL